VRALAESAKPAPRFPPLLSIKLWFFLLRRPAGEKRAFRLNPIAAALGAVFAILVAIEAHGIRTSDLFSQDIWHPEGWRRFVKYAEVYAGLAVILIFAAPRSFAAILAVLLAGLTILSVGPAPLAAVGLFFLSANALGSMLLRMQKQHEAEDHVCAT